MRSVASAMVFVVALYLMISAVGFWWLLAGLAFMVLLHIAKGK